MGLQVVAQTSVGREVPMRLVYLFLFGSPSINPLPMFKKKKKEARSTTKKTLFVVVFDFCIGFLYFDFARQFWSGTSITKTEQYLQVSCCSQSSWRMYPLV